MARSIARARLVGSGTLAGFVTCLIAGWWTPAFAQATRCGAIIADRDLRTATGTESAITVDIDSPVVVVLDTDVPAESVAVSMAFGSLRAPVYPNPAPLDRRHVEESLPVGDWAFFGVGLYQLTATIDRCPPFVAYVRVVGRSPFLTVPGVLATGVLMVGLVLGASGLLSAARGGRAWGRATVGGAAFGFGTLVLFQQAGIVPIDDSTLVLWTAVPGAGGTVAHGLVGMVAGSLRRTPDTPPPAGPAYQYPTPTGRGPSYAPPSYPPHGPPSSGPPRPPYGMPPGYASSTSSPPYVPPPPAARPTGYPPSQATIGQPQPTPTSAGYVGAEPPSPGPVTDGMGPGEPASEQTVPDAEPEPLGAEPEPLGGEHDPTAEAAAEPDPPREAYAHLACADAVVRGVEFPLEVGLSATADAAVIGGPMRRPETSMGSYVITIQVIADGFRMARPDGSWRVDLPVTAEDPYPRSTMHLLAEPDDRRVAARTIRAMFSVEGQPIGLALRPLAVVADASLLGQAAAPVAPPVDMHLPQGERAPDLTIRIEVGETAGQGRLLWQLLAADPGVQVPAEPIVVDIGTDPQGFLRGIIREMNAAEGQPGMYQAMMGIGLTISEQLPAAFWQVLAQVGERSGERPPTILILSAEPYVPWELAVVEPPLDPSSPPFLSAQAVVGRWVLGQRRPKLPPPSSLRIGRMAVVSGIYGSQPGWERLYDAEQEAAEMAQRFGATPVNAASQDVLRLVKGEPPADVMHFAVHGQYDPTGEIDGLVLVDGLTLDPMRVRGSPLRSGPFVFLNACQVGSGEAVLGDYSGLAEAFLFAGASGVIAPLWSIDDVIAREIALRFYDKTLAGDAPAEVLRRERSAFTDEHSTISSTYLAYQFFGHPNLIMARASV